MLSHLASNVTFLIPIWTMLATDGTRASYCAHTRNVTFNSLAYTAAPVEPSRFSQTLGLDANHVELFGVFDDIVTEANLQGGKWKNAKITFEYIAYDPATGVASAIVTGSVGKMKGQAGKFSVNNGTFRLEFRSLSDLLSQEIGSYTSPIDSRRKLEDLGITTTPFIFARTVTAFTGRRNFTVGGTAQVNNYFAYGRVKFLTGANANLEMEIKASVGNAIELQLAMRSNIAIGDTCNLYAGYDGSRTQARDKFNAMEGFEGTPDLPGLSSVLKYPE